MIRVGSSCVETGRCHPPASPRICSIAPGSWRKGILPSLPFERLATYIDDLQMVVQMFPVDLDLPGVAEVTGTDGARLLAAHVPESPRRGEESTGSSGRSFTTGRAIVAS